MWPEDGRVDIILANAVVDDPTLGTGNEDVGDGISFTDALFNRYFGNGFPKVLLELIRDDHHLIEVVVSGDDPFGDFLPRLRMLQFSWDSGDAILE
jgi:hypothetical protein